MINPQLLEFLSWKVVSGLLRRHPRKFRVIETHPGGGQYDCLALIDSHDQIAAEFNRRGRLHIHKRRGRSLGTPRPIEIWDELISADKFTDVLDHVSDALGLRNPARLPPSTPSVIIYRFVAALLSTTVLRRSQWECRNGFLDTSGYDDGVVSHFEAFPNTQEHLSRKRNDDVLGQPAYRFWFILRDGQAQLCLETTGQIWQCNGRSFDAVSLYGKEHRIWPLVSSIMGHLLG
jgi:hypothetical protein